MKLVHIANLTGGAFFSFVGFMGVAHGVESSAIFGGGFLVAVGCFYICGAVHCLTRSI